MNETLLLSKNQSFPAQWERASAALAKELNQQSYKAWIEPIRPVGLENQTVRLGVPDKFCGDWLKEHYLPAIISALTAELEFAPEIIFVWEEKFSAPSKKSAPFSITAAAQSAAETQLNSRYNFDNFVIGPGNRFAHAAALAVSEKPGFNYNPLFLYGSVGLGKTHLMQSIAHSVLQKDPRKKVLYLSSEKFTNELIGAIQSRGTEAFRRRYRNMDVLLVDDIHFLAGKEATMEEFFHTFNALYDAHKQIIVASDRMPREIPGLEERLVSRFGWGLIADIQRPDFETRVAILQKKIEKEPVSVPREVLHYVAERISSNIRELEGAMIRVIAFASLSGVSIDLALAQKVLENSFREEEKNLSIETIQKKVAEHFHLKVSDLRAKSRSKSINHPRQIAMYLIREHTSHSLLEIGEYFGGRNHATVLHSIQNIKDLLSSDLFFKQTVEKLVENLKPKTR